MMFNRFVSRTIKMAAVLAISSALLLTNGATASAATPSGNADKVVAHVLGAADPAVAYRALSASERASFDYRMLPVKTLRVITISPADATAVASFAAGKSPEGLWGVMATGCWVARGNGSGKAAAGNTLFTYFTTLRWCASGSTVTSASLFEAGGETSTPGWRYDGVKASGSAVLGNVARTYARHRFILGIGGWDVQTSDNCLRVFGTAAPSASADGVCGVS